MDIQFLHDPDTVGFRRFRTDAHCASTLFGGFAFRNQLQNLLFSWAQGIRRNFGIVLVSLDDRIADRWAQLSSPARGFANYPNQILRRVRFHHETIGSAKISSVLVAVRNLASVIRRAIPGGARCNFVEGGQRARGAIPAHLEGL